MPYKKLQQFGGLFADKGTLIERQAYFSTDKGQLLIGKGDSTDWMANFKSTSDVKSISAGYAGQNNDSYSLILATGGSSGLTYTLPPLPAFDGQEITVMKADSGSGVITVSGTILGSNIGLGSVTIPVQFSSIKFKWSGTSWYEISRDMKYAKHKMCQYIGGNTYNSIALTVSNGYGGSNIRNTFLPYQTWDGTWKIIINISTTASPGNGGSWISINGITFQSGPYQSLSIAMMNIGSGCAYAIPGGSSIGCWTNAGWGYNSVSGEAEMTGKPAWVA